MSIKTLLADVGVLESDASEVSEVKAITVPEPKKEIVQSDSPTAANTELSEKLMAEVRQAAPKEFFQFEDMLTRMTAIPGMSPGAQWQAAAAAVGITVANVSSAMEAMQKRLASEEADYQRLIAESMQERVVRKREEVDALRKQADALEQEIEMNAAAIQESALTFAAAVKAVHTQIEGFRPKE